MNQRDHKKPEKYIYMVIMAVEYIETDEVQIHGVAGIPPPPHIGL